MRPDFITSASMATKITVVSATSSALAVLVTTAAVSACTPRPEGPAPVAERYFAALSTGDTAAAAELSDAPSDAREALNAAWAGLPAGPLDTQMPRSKNADSNRTGD